MSSKARKLHKRELGEFLNFIGALRNDVGRSLSEAFPKAHHYLLLLQVLFDGITELAMYADEQESHDLLTLAYGKHHATIVDEIKTCFFSENFADMTFVCDDKTTLSAHKLVMAAVSPLIRTILGENTHSHGPSVVLIPGIKSSHMRHLLDFLYHGQAYVKVSTYSFHVNHLISWSDAYSKEEKQRSQTYKSTFEMFVSMRK